MNRDAIGNELSQILIEEFEIPKEEINEDAHLYEDLDLDSIDAIDLVVKLQNLTKTKLDADSFKKVRTVGDVLDELEKIIK